ncbi:unnamed protein product [Arctogadus glacialis]
MGPLLEPRVDVGPRKLAPSIKRLIPGTPSRVTSGGSVNDGGGGEVLSDTDTAAVAEALLPGKKHTRIRKTMNPKTPSD